MGNLNDIPEVSISKIGGVKNHPYGFRGFSIGYTLDAVGPIVVASMLSIFVRAGSTMEWIGHEPKWCAAHTGKKCSRNILKHVKPY